jgi:hypothetical protein
LRRSFVLLRGLDFVSSFTLSSLDIVVECVFFVGIGENNRIALFLGLFRLFRLFRLDVFFFVRARRSLGGTGQASGVMSVQVFLGDHRATRAYHEIGTLKVGGAEGVNLVLSNMFQQVTELLLALWTTTGARARCSFRGHVDGKA